MALPLLPVKPTGISELFSIPRKSDMSCLKKMHKTSPPLCYIQT